MVLPLGAARPTDPPTSFPTDISGTIGAVTIAGINGTLDPPEELDFAVDFTNGNDGNDGTPANPWKTLSKVAASSFSPGDVIGFRRDETWPEALDFPSSGSSGNPIKLVAYGSGAIPHWRGSDDVFGVSGDWTEDVVGVRWSRTYVPDTDLSLDSGFVFFGTGGNPAVATSYKEDIVSDVTASGKWFYDSGINKLSIYSVNNPTVDYTSLRAISRRQGLEITGHSFIDVENIRVSEFSSSNIRLNNSPDINFTGVAAHHNADDECWDIFGTSSNINVTNCAGYRAGAGLVELTKASNTHGFRTSGSDSTGVVLDGNMVGENDGGGEGGSWGDNGEDGITTSSGGSGTVLTIRNVTTKNNAENGFDHKAGDVLIEDTIMHSGFDTSAGVSPITMQPGSGNTLTLVRSVFVIEDGTTTQGIFVQSGTLIMKECDFIGGSNGSDIIRLQGSGIDGCSLENVIVTKRGAAAGTAAILMKNDVNIQMQLDHVTVYAPVNTRCFRIEGTGSGPSADINNSIFVNSGTKEVIDQDVTGGMGEITGNNNLLYKQSGSVYVDWEGTDYDATDVTDGTLQVDHGIGDNWITASDPLFIDQDNDDFKLNAGSPAREATSSGSTTTIDRDARARNVTATLREVGAFEFI